MDHNGFRHKRKVRFIETACKLIDICTRYETSSILLYSILRRIETKNVNWNLFKTFLFRIPNKSSYFERLIIIYDRLFILRLFRIAYSKAMVFNIYIYNENEETRPSFFPVNINLKYKREEKTRVLLLWFSNESRERST